MNRFNIFVYPMVAALSVLAAAAAHAESPAPAQLEPAAFVSTKTRADVMAEFKEARRTGAMRVASTSYNPFADMKGSLSRDLVRAETLAMNRGGHAHDMNGEDSGSFALARTMAPRTAPTLTLASR